MSNNIISGNLGYLLGGGIWVQNSAPLIESNRIEHNHIISLTASVPVGVTSNDFYANATHQRGFALDVTNIVINPQLDSRFHLNANSPLIDAGTRPHAPDHDVDGQPRPMIGASGLFGFFFVTGRPLFRLIVSGAMVYAVVRTFWDLWKLNAFHTASESAPRNRSR